MVLRLRSASDVHRQRAFEELCQSYWRPLYTFARRGGCSTHDAEDLTQGFLAQLLDRGDLGFLTPEKGQLRHFLKVSFQNFMDDQAPAYGEVARRIGQTENTVAAAVSRMRREFRELLRCEIADTLGDGEDIDEELQYLLRVVE